LGKSSFFSLEPYLHNSTASLYPCFAPVISFFSVHNQHMLIRTSLSGVAGKRRLVTNQVQDECV
jgi:hypothetical protein